VREATDPSVAELAHASDGANETYERWVERVRAVGSAWEAWLRDGRDLRAARHAFHRAGRSHRLDTHSRASALLNAANCLSEVGRLFDALDIYAEADRLRPNDGMVRGNRGIVLTKLGLNYPQSHRLLVARAIEDLTFAVSADHLDGDAGNAFERWLERLVHHRDDAVVEEREPVYEDPYSEWAYQQNLLLSPTVGRRPPEERLDDAMITGLVTGLDAWSVESPLPEVFSAVNAIKRDYATARFIAYIASERPPDARLGTRSRSTRYADTLDYARWDLSAGLMASAYASTINLADKIATLLALWLGLPSDRVNDRNWAFERAVRKRRKQQAGQPAPRPVRAPLVALMEHSHGRLNGLLGLIDQAQEEAESEVREGRRATRDAAVHAFLSVRLIQEQRRTGLVVAVSQEDLERDTLAALRQVRRMFLQATLAVSEKGRLDARDESAPALVTDYDDPLSRDEP
jgi:tetratricopeptide (TPR) repeat protein